MNENITVPTPNGAGFLVVQVTTANGSIPLENAQVTIRQASSEGRNVLYELRTGSVGRTARVSLPAPPRALSLSADNPTPYAVYNVEAVMPNYLTASYDNVPIFDGITAIQQANLAPIPENGYPDGFTLNNSRPFDGTLETP